jgi:hypothetical protein
MKNTCCKFLNKFLNILVLVLFLGLNLNAFAVSAFAISISACASDDEKYGNWLPCYETAAVPTLDDMLVYYGSSEEGGWIVKLPFGTVKEEIFSSLAENRLNGEYEIIKGNDLFLFKVKNGKAKWLTESLFTFGEYEDVPEYAEAESSYAAGISIFSKDEEYLGTTDDIHSAMEIVAQKDGEFRIVDMRKLNIREAVMNVCSGHCGWESEVLWDIPEEFDSLDYNRDGELSVLDLIIARKNGWIETNQFGTSLSLMLTGCDAWRIEIG